MFPTDVIRKLSNFDNGASEFFFIKIFHESSVLNPIKSKTKFIFSDLNMHSLKYFKQLQHQKKRKQNVIMKFSHFFKVFLA